MNMIKIVTLAWMLVVAPLAYANSAPVTNTFEVSIYSVRLPVSPNGTVALRECEDCDYHSIRVTPETQYIINDKHLRLNQFRKRILELKLRGDITVNVRRDDATNTVASVFIRVH